MIRFRRACSSQKALCRGNAVAENFLPQKGHCCLSSSAPARASGTPSIEYEEYDPVDPPPRIAASADRSCDDFFLQSACLPTFARPPTGISSTHRRAPLEGPDGRFVLPPPRLAAAGPARMAAHFDIELPEPRTLDVKTTEKFGAYTREIYHLLGLN